MIEFNCPDCNKQIRVKPELAGRTGKCPGCGQKILVPSPSVLKDVPTQLTVKPKTIAQPTRQVPEVTLPQFPQSLQTAPNVSTVVQPKAHPTNAIQVNVHNSHASNSLGISSLILGILSFFVCWIPFIGFGLSGLGLLLGIAGIVMSVFRKGTGIGYSIAGAAVNSIALCFGIIFITVFASTMASVDGTMKRLKAERDKVPQQASPVTPGAMNQGVAIQDPASDIPIVDPSATANAKPTIVFNPAAEPLQLGNVQLRITEAKLGKVDLTQMFSKNDSESKEELLTVRVQITNTSTTKKLDYRGWMASLSSMSGITAKLTDENDNRYKVIDFSSSVRVKGASTNDSIYPGKSLDDAIVFEVPVENAKQLFLTLAGKGCQQDGEFRFEIPRAMIKR